jgi:hypothetical protein
MFAVLAGRAVQVTESVGIGVPTLRHYLINLNLGVGISVVINIVSIQFRHQNCGYAMKRAWNSAYHVVVLKYVNEKEPPRRKDGSA